MNQIVIKGAKENNLKNIDLVIPRNRVVCLVGVSGSGKSTIAFDIIAREGQRQYFESLPAYARRYLSKSNRPEADEIQGISASIIISQDRIRGNPRSTVGTLTEAYTYLRLLYSRVGRPSMDSSYYSFNHPYGACKKCKGLGRAVKVSVDKVIDKSKSLNEGALVPSDWYVGGRQWSIVKASGYFDMDKKLTDYRAGELDRILYAPPEMLQSVSGKFIDRWTFQGVVHRIIHRNNNAHRSLSENDMKYFDLVDCPECHGGRLNSKSLEVRLNGKNIGEVGNLPLEECLAFVKSLDHKNAEVIKPRLIDQLQGLINIGVGYLSLNRSADTLSGGEAQRHNLKNLNLAIPTGVMVGLTGVSGSGKSSLIEEIISQHEGKIVLIDQSPVGANKRGCLATYVGVFDKIRQLFAQKHRMHPSFFSYNSHGGCVLCKGVGFIEMDMNFLGDVKIKCENCGGTRYKNKVLRYQYRGKNIVEVLAMTAAEVGQFFDNPEISKATNLLQEVGLDYMEMGQTLDTLSGGESQRLKLSSRLQNQGEFYILDEPTSGLHFADVAKLLKLLNRLVDNGNTILVIEHNLDVIKNCDWIVDLGPEGGDRGGRIVAQGTPLQISQAKASYTGQFLKKVYY